MSNPDPDFWAFALRIYDLPDVRDTCLKLQDEQGLDVMVLLCNLWIGLCDGTLPQPALAALMDTGATWQSAVTTPLRQTRRWLATDTPTALDGATETLHGAVQNAELMAEQLVAQLLVHRLKNLASPKAPAGAAAALANARTYTLLCGVPRTATVEARLALLVDAAANAAERR